MQLGYICVLPYRHIKEAVTVTSSRESAIRIIIAAIAASALLSAACCAAFIMNLGASGRDGEPAPLSDTSVAAAEWVCAAAAESAQPQMYL